MKRIAITVLVTLLMTTGLLGAAPATGAGCSSYAGCVNTKTVARGPSFVARKSKAMVCGRVKALGSNARPTGKLKYVVKRNRGNFKFATKVRYDGGKRCIRTRKLKKPGGYTVYVQFVPNNGSLFNASSGSAGFDVVR